MMALAVLAGFQPPVLEAQARTALGIRGGAGLVSGGRPAYAAQIEVVDMAGGSSVEVAVTGWAGLDLTREYRASGLLDGEAYSESLSLWGGGVMANFLWGHSRRSFGPYALIGIGLGPVWFDWRVDSTDPRFGTPAAGGGSLRAEERMMVSSFLSLGIGQRLLGRFDVRAQGLLILVPSTTLREQIMKVPLLTLTSGIGL